MGVIFIGIDESFYGEKNENMIVVCSFSQNIEDIQEKKLIKGAQSQVTNTNNYFYFQENYNNNFKYILSKIIESLNNHFYPYKLKILIDGGKKKLRYNNKNIEIDFVKQGEKLIPLIHHSDNIAAEITRSIKTNNKNKFKLFNIKKLDLLKTA